MSEIDWFEVAEKLTSDDILHKGTPHEGSTPHSGRYPYGSGMAAYQRAKDFNGEVNKLKKSGMSWADIAKDFGIDIRTLRAKIAENKEVAQKYSYLTCKEMSDAGMSVSDISKETGITSSTVRRILIEGDKRLDGKITNTKEVLKKVLDEGYAVDYGKGVERYLGVTDDCLTKAALLLANEGYNAYSDMQIKQTTGSNFTEIRVLAPKDMTKADIMADMSVVKLPFEYSEDGGNTYVQRKPPVNVARDRIYVRYAEEGGKDRDGTIEIRRGCPDLDLGNANYAQVRIAVEGGKYMKGMCMYGDIPDGYDIVYNSNKKKGTPDFKYDENGKVKGGVFKPQDTADPLNPFGASIKDEDQLKLIRTSTYKDKNGKTQQSALNIVNEEGDWGNWSASLASQFLSKQDTKLAKRQLDKTFKEHLEQYNDILKIENPYVKEKLLRSFSDECDSDAVHLKAAALPRQGTHAILPEPTLKENEIFAPSYKNGEEVVLVRYPHGGIFEIPRLIVNNTNKEAQKKITLGAKDAVMIHPKAAEQLSGADFDGDTALVIPTTGLNIKTHDPLPGLKNFDPDIYNLRSTGKKYTSLTKKNKGGEMGKITNLITDMTIKGATWEEIERATKYSMVVIDSPKHDLDYKQAKIDYGIKELVDTYQRQPDGKIGGSSTLISRAKSQQRVRMRKASYRINPETGEKVFYNSDKYGHQWEVKLGEEGGDYEKKLKSTKMYETNDAHTLSSGYLIEEIYADYANNLKALANRARKSSVEVSDIPYSKSAAHIYEKQVESLNNKLALAEKNAPLERQANLIANKVVEMRAEEHPEWDKDDLKKAKNIAIKDARQKTGAAHYDFKIEPDEWEALNSGAVNKSTQKEIFKRTSDEYLKEHAIPRTKKEMSDNQKSLCMALYNSGYSVSEIADKLGFSTTTISNTIK